jgi:succinoglycan biosynthesis transport protein ExoP
MSDDRDLMTILQRHEALQLRHEHGLEVSGEISLQEMTGVLRRRKWVVLCSIGVTLALAVVASLTITPKYESTAVLEINQDDVDILGLGNAGNGTASGTNALEFNVNMDAHERALQTDDLAMQVIVQLRLDTKPEFSWKPSRFDSDQVKAEMNAPLENAPHKRERLLKAFHRQLKVKAIAGSRLVEVRFRDSDPQVAADVANALTNAYIEQCFHRRYAATAQVSDWLSKQLNELKAQVAALDQKVVDYQKQAGILGTDGATDIVTSKLEDLNKKVTEAEGNRITRQAIYSLVKNGNAELVSGLAGSSFSGPGFAGQNPLETLQHLRAREQDLKIQYAEAAKKFGPAYPKLIQIKNEMDTLSAAIENESGKVERRAENDYLAAQNAERMLRVSFAHQTSEANKLNSKAIQFSILKHEAESSRKLYDDLELKLKSAGVLSSLRPTNMFILEPGRPSTEPVRSPLMIIGLGLIAGVLFGVALAFGQAALDKTIRNPKQAEAVTLLPDMGIIPDLQSLPLSRWELKNIANSSKPIAVIAAESSIAEAYRQLRTSICVSSTQPPKVIMITSPMMHDGKTTTAINLATVLAQQGAKVLLVDADLRRPSIQKRLWLPSREGLSRILAESKNGKSNLIGVLRRTITQYPDQPGLFVLGAGERTVQTAELLGSEQMTKLIEVWRNCFDFVVIDSSPLLTVTDAVVLSAKVDSVLIVVRSEATPKEALLRARNLLLRANANIIGVLVNAVTLSSSDYYGYYGANIEADSRVSRS